MIPSSIWSVADTAYLVCFPFICLIVFDHILAGYNAQRTRDSRDPFEYLWSLQTAYAWEISF